MDVLLHSGLKKQCSSLFNASREGNVGRAEEILQQMIDDGFEPGPCAYHALVFAHVKSGSASGALTAIRRAHAAGHENPPFCID